MDVYGAQNPSQLTCEGAYLSDLTFCQMILVFEPILDLNYPRMTHKLQNNNTATTRAPSSLLFQTPL